MTAYLPLFVALIATLLATTLPIRLAFQVPVFLLPWYGLTPDLGVSIPLGYMLFLVLAIRMQFRGYLYFDRLPASLSIGLATVVGIASAAFTLAGDYSFAQFAGGSLRNGWFRVLVVSIKYLWSFLPVLLLLNLPRHMDMSRVLRTYLLSVLVLCGLGILQFTVFEFTGRDIFPLGLFTREDGLRSAVIQYAGSDRLRPGSLAGEPKSLGMCAATVIILLLGSGRDLIGAIGLRVLALFIAAATVVLTQSTSALLSVPAAVGVWLILKFLKKPLPQNIVFTAYVVLAGVFLGHSVDSVWSSSRPLVAAEQQDSNETVLDNLYTRSIGRARVEDFDWVIIKSMQGEPLSLIHGRGFGLGHLDVARYIPREWSYYMARSIVFPKTGATYFLVNGGILTVIAMCWFFARLTPTINTHRSGARAIRTAQLTIIPLIVLLLLRIYVYDVVLLVSAAVYAQSGTYPRRQTRSVVEMQRASLSSDALTLANQTSRRP